MAWTTPGLLLRAHGDLRHYLPARRYAQFMRAWVFGGGISGSVHRARARRRLGFAPPRNVNVSLTEACNLTCRGCYAAAYKRGPAMPAEQFDAIVTQAEALGVSVIGVLGGEPLLARQMLPVMERHRGMAFRISTNGTLIDDEFIAFLSGNGHVVPFLSLEGFEEETDWWRGEGVFETIERAMRRLRQERILFGFAATMHRKNQTVVVSRSFLRAMRALGNRFAVYFTYGPVGRQPMYDLLLTPAEYAAATRALEQNAVDAGLIVKVEGYRGRPGSPYRALNGPGCQAGRCVHITPTGAIEPCNAMQFHAANVFEQELGDALQRPFYTDVRAAVGAMEGPCMAIRSPETLLEIVERNHPEESNRQARTLLEAFVADQRRRVQEAR